MQASPALPWAAGQGGTLTFAQPFTALRLQQDLQLLFDNGQNRVFIGQINSTGSNTFGVRINNSEQDNYIITLSEDGLSANIEAVPGWGDSIACIDARRLTAPFNTTGFTFIEINNFPRLAIEDDAGNKRLCVDRSGYLTDVIFDDVTEEYQVEVAFGEDCSDDPSFAGGGVAALNESLNQELVCIKLLYESCSITQGTIDATLCVDFLGDVQDLTSNHFMISPQGSMMFDLVDFAPSS